MMSDLPEADKSGVEFKWGKKMGLGKEHKHIQFYESFTYDGVEYNLYDCVYMYKEGESEPYIGKLVKIWEHIDTWKRVKVHWFFKPSEISYYLKDEKVMNKELFVASEQGVGLSNVNELEAVSGKCNIVCISKDRRNPQPSKEEIEAADYVFYRTFRVDTCTISDQIGDKVGDLDVKFVFNRKTLPVNNNIDSGASEDRPLKRVKLHSSVQSDDGKDLRRNNKPENEEKSKTVKEVPEIKKKLVKKIGRDNGEGVTQPLKSPSGLDIGLVHKEKTNNEKNLKLNESKEKTNNEKNIKLSESKEKSGASKSEKKDVYEKIIKGPQNSTDLQKVNTNKSSIGASNTEKKITYSKSVQVTRKPLPDTKNTNTWFKELAWDDRIVSAKDEGKLVQFINLDPDYTSADVEDIVYHAFNEHCTAKMMQHTAISSPHCGIALAIFKVKEVADRVVRGLREGCLLLSNGRPLVARIVNMPTPSTKQTNFVGHLTIDKLKHKTKDMREAVSTSHFSQPNTIEFEMAMEWLTLQARSQECWKRLYKGQEQEIEKLKNKFKLK